jgi:23S rRNA (adenine1618-N6)-methyltransferase
VRVLDLGTGANVVYPLIGQHSYGWQFVGVDIDQTALNNAQQIIDKNKGLAAAINLRLQPSPISIFHGVILPDESFALTMCNPPFHSSKADAQAGTERKWNGLGKSQHKHALNFGGHNAELYCESGEAGFIQRMILESVSYQRQVGWFTTLVSKVDNLPKIYKTLKQINALEVVTLPMRQGQKQSRIVAWRFF